MQFHTSLSLLLIAGAATLAAAAAAVTNDVSPRAKLAGIGKTCEKSVQCESGYCNKAKCAKPGGKGTPCTKNEACATDKDGALRYCVKSKTTVYTLNNGPVKLKTNTCSPAPYANVMQGGYCLHSSQCYIDLYCTGFKCTPTVGTGELCDKDSACKYGTCGDDGKCTGREIGRHCGEDYQCASGFCYHGYENLETQDTCQPAPTDG